MLSFGQQGIKNLIKKYTPKEKEKKIDEKISRILEILHSHQMKKPAIAYAIAKADEISGDLNLKISLFTALLDVENARAFTLLQQQNALTPENLLLLTSQNTLFIQSVNACSDDFFKKIAEQWKKNIEIADLNSVFKQKELLILDLFQRKILTKNALSILSSDYVTQEECESFINAISLKPVTSPSPTAASPASTDKSSESYSAISSPSLSSTASTVSVLSEETKEISSESHKNLIDKALLNYFKSIITKTQFEKALAIYNKQKHPSSHPDTDVIIFTLTRHFNQAHDVYLCNKKDWDHLFNPLNRTAFVKYFLGDHRAFGKALLQEAITPKATSNLTLK